MGNIIEMWFASVSSEAFCMESYTCNNALDIAAEEATGVKQAPDYLRPYTIQMRWCRMKRTLFRTTRPSQARPLRLSWRSQDLHSLTCILDDASACLHMILSQIIV